MNSQFARIILTDHGRFSLPRIAELLLEAPVLAPRSSPQLDLRDDSFTFHCSEFSFTLELDPTPIPTLHLDSLCTLTTWWKDAKSQLKKQKCGILLSVTSSTIEHIQAAIYLSHIVCEIIELYPVVGVLWGKGILNEANDFKKLAQQVTETSLIPSLWVNIRVIRLDNGSYCLYTLGLEEFDRLDLEIDSFESNDPSKFVRFVHSLLEAEMLGRIVLKDGVVLGKIRVREGFSILDEEKRVLKLLP